MTVGGEIFGKLQSTSPPYKHQQVVIFAHFDRNAEGKQIGTTLRFNTFYLRNCWDMTTIEAILKTR